MTVRDVYAGQAMQAMIAIGGFTGADAYEQHSDEAYRIADAMLKARAK